MEAVPVGVKFCQISEQKTFNDQLFPAVLSPDNNKDINHWLQWVQNNTDNVKQILFKYGAILFRGFPVDEPEIFDNFVKAFGYDAFPYVGGAAPRKIVVGNVFTANEAPPSELIPHHHEMAQVPNFPKVLFFYCYVAPTEGGETPLVPSNIVYQKMVEREPQFVERLEKEGVRYTRVLPNGDDPSSPIGRGWQSTFQTENKAEAEAKAKSQGTSFEWLSDGSLKTTTKELPAVREDTRNGKKMWFNSIIAAYLGWQDCRNDRKKAITFANGDLMPESAMETLAQVMEELSVCVRWQKGDVIMVDNRQALHARRSFTPPRRIMACLCNES